MNVGQSRCFGVKYHSCIFFFNYGCDRNDICGNCIVIWNTILSTFTIQTLFLPWLFCSIKSRLLPNNISCKWPQNIIQCKLHWLYRKITKSASIEHSDMLHKQEAIQHIWTFLLPFLNNHSLLQTELHLSLVTIFVKTWARCETVFHFKSLSAVGSTMHWKVIILREQLYTVRATEENRHCW